jgi:hypothetical protein
MNLVTIYINDKAESWKKVGFDVNERQQIILRNAVIVLRSDPLAIGGITHISVRNWKPASKDNVQVQGLHFYPPPHKTVSFSDDYQVLHSNGIESLDHIVVMTSDVQELQGGLERAFKVKPTREILRGTNSYAFYLLGPRYSKTSETPHVSSPVLEVVHSQDATAVLQKVGASASFWGLAFVSAELKKTHALLAPKIGDIKSAFQPGRSLATLRHEQLGISVPSIVLSRRPSLHHTTEKGSQQVKSKL